MFMDSATSGWCSDRRYGRRALPFCHPPVRSSPTEFRTECPPAVRYTGWVLGRTDDTPAPVHGARFPVAERPTMVDVDFSPRPTDGHPHWRHDHASVGSYH